MLKVVATKLISTVGGAAGPLFGTAYLKAAQAAGDATELDADGLVAVLTAARDGIVSRGKATVGDKTMVDAWSPASTPAQPPRRPATARNRCSPPPRTRPSPAPSRPTRSSPTRAARATSGGSAPSGTATPGRSRRLYILRAAVDATRGDAA